MMLGKASLVHLLCIFMEESKCKQYFSNIGKKNASRFINSTVK